MAIATTQRPEATRTFGARLRAFDWRAILFRGVALLINFLVLPAMLENMLSPWRLATPNVPNYTPELHRWHGTDVAALLIVLVCGSALALIPRPRSAPLLAQFVLLAVGIFSAALTWPFVPDVVIPFVIVGALFAASYPDTRALFSFSREGAASRPLLALSAIAAVPLLGNAWSNLHLQHTDLSEHAHHSHWNGSFALALTLILAGFLVASRRPGWKVLGMLLALAYLYLGVSALLIPGYDGSWGYLGGMLALIGAVAFSGMTFVEGRRTGRGLA
jgi:hypothetical protein